MCGIAGKITTGAPVDPRLIHRMCATLRHRGPDAQNAYVEGHAALGMTRLAIIDLLTGDQPLYSEDRRAVLVLNGEIYNHLELRDGLIRRGHRFSSHSDAEVVVHLWEELGPRCVERLRGMYALAVWDDRRGELFLARDRVGKKPLYYAHHDGALVFASEPRAILQDSAIPRDVDLAAVDAFLVNQYVPHDRCAFRALRKLPPASTLTWRPGSEPVVESYWRLEYEPKVRLSFDEAMDRLRHEVLDATRIRLMSDVPLGAFLSGGLDSSVVVAAMAMSSAEPVRTFSAAFPGTPVDESRHARQVASAFGTEHHELEVGPPDPSVLSRMAWHFGEPFADPAALPTFQLSELVRRHVTVALNGDGGDESFAGYRRYRHLRLSRPGEYAPAVVRRRAEIVAGRFAGEGAGHRVQRAARLAHRLALPPARRYADLFRFFGESDRKRLYTPDFRAIAEASDPLAHVVRAWDARPALNWTDRPMATDLDTYLPDDLLAKVDLASMAHSVEVRSPLLDAELMSFAASLPVAFKARRGASKIILRALAAQWLPAGVAARPKQGFHVPIATWLRNELRSVPEDLLLDQRALDRGLFVPGEIERLINEHQAGADRSQQLWAMIGLELWFRTSVDAMTTTGADVPVLA